MTQGWPFTAEKLAARLRLIGKHVCRNHLPLPAFRMLPINGAVVDAPICADPEAWEEIPHDSYWGRADLNFVMKSSFQVPGGWDANRIALHLPLGILGDIFNHPEALVHIDTKPIGSSDRFHHTIPLSAALADGGPHVVSLHGWTGLAGWPPDPNNRSKLFMGVPALVERDPDLVEFVQLGVAVLDSANTVESQTGQALLGVLDQAMQMLDTRAPIGPALYDSVPEALRFLKQAIPNAGAPLDMTLHGIGHAHMDIAYLWTIDQIRLKNARTYSNVLRLMESDPDYVFSHSQPQLYDYTAQDYPEIFDQI
ncbi:MAG: alpha-mannosidase, partial [Pseudomonadota bacterium]